MNRTSINTGAGIVGAFSLFAVIVPTIFKIIGWIEWAQGIGDALAIFADPRIHWQGIYLFLVFAAFGILVANNWLAVWRWKVRRDANAKREWTMTFNDAAQYVRLLSHFGDSLSANWKTGLSQAAWALQEAAKAGKIKVAGRYWHTATLTEIPCKYWKVHEFDCTVEGSEYRSEVRDAQLRDPKNPDKDKIIVGLMVERYEIERVWKKKPLQY